MPNVIHQPPEGSKDGGLLPAQAKSIINRSHEHFHASSVSPGDMTHSLEMRR